ncbi:MAG: multiheme c-type cytochrome, partial [Haliangium ochraceum]
MPGWLAWAPGVLVVLASATGAELFSRGLAPVESGLGRAGSAAACAGCHPQEHAEWAASRHGRAWTNAIFQREYKDRPLDWCVHCHAPLREQIEQVRSGGGALADEGVTCVACHVRNGRMLARTRAAGSPHETETRPDFGGPGYCAGCHQFNYPLIAADGQVVRYTDHPMQATVAQHAQGPRASRECLSCHAADGRHRFPGGHDPTMLARAVEMSACRADRVLEVVLKNAGAGHNVPTGDVHRHLVGRVWRPGAPERLQEAVLGRRFAPAPDGGKLTVADTTIPAGTST